VDKRTEKEIETVNYHPYPDANDPVVFPTLADSELAVLEALGTRRPVASISIERGTPPTTST